ncbi:uncharacterized protein [Phyllobates terribilis]|uniref:uncharacterized protein n=1 Tax=Phyllobates terribilis TaxID=111132 RepID=UPI003CCAF5D1
MILEEVRNLLQYFQEVQSTHCFKEPNQPADSLSKNVIPRLFSVASHNLIFRSMMIKYDQHRQCIWSLCAWACLVILISNNGVAEGSHKAGRGFESIQALAPVRKLLRPAFHFQPPNHWINDPNGPMYYKGIYHLFYQYNPKGSVWGNIVWAHSVSTDMINWQSLDPAIYPSKPFDIEGCWSGSATILPKSGPAILYTGLDPQMNQVQNIALPANLSDPYLRVWVKPDYNPLVVPGPEMNTSCFRDPTTAWFNNGHWKMLVGGRQHRGGVVYLYRSKDFKTWVKAKHPLHFVRETGMFECPDFFPVSVTGQTGLDTSFSVKTGGRSEKHVLKVSLDLTRYEYYTVGRYEKSIDRYFPDDPSMDGWHGLRYDYGNFYASKTFFDPKKNRRILWGWANESDVDTMDVQKGWAGIQTIPRKVWLDPKGKQLLQWPIEEIETLRQGHPVQIRNHVVHKSQLVEVKGITAAQADVDVVFRLPNSLDSAEKLDRSRWNDAQDLCAHKGSTVEGGVGPFGLLTLASPMLDEYTPVFFRVFKSHNNTHTVLLCSDASTSTLMSAPKMYKPSFAGFVDVDLTDRKLSLRSLIDHSVVESFGEKGKTCITSRVYPTKAVFNRAHLYVFNNGTSPVTVEILDAWSMASPAKMNQPLSSWAALFLAKEPCGEENYKEKEY